MTPKYLSHLREQYKPFTDLIANNTCRLSHIAEFGCGAGNITKILIEDYNISNNTCLDVDSDILHIANRNIDSHHVSSLRSSVCYKKADIRDKVGHFDIIHSHGVLEHLPDDVIQEAIKSQLSQANTLIHYVPSNKYGFKSFGDERLLSKEEWVTKHKPTNIVEFNDGFDIILVWSK